jgi:Zn-finger nucleic acid-binding protein
MSRVRPLCGKCRVEFVYCDPSAPMSHLCEPCYWAWQDGGAVEKIAHGRVKRSAYRSKWSQRGSSSN